MAATLYFEDFAAGVVVECGGRAVTTEEAIAFATAYDPQPMHTDPAVAEKTLLEGLALSGWLTCSIGQRILVDGFLNRVACLGAPGIQSVRWRRPARPDSPLAGRLQIQSVRPSRSRPEFGFVAIEYTLSQGGEPVCIEHFAFMVASRHAGALGPSDRAADSSAVDMPVEWAGAVAPEAAPLSATDAAASPLGVPVFLGESALTAEDIIAFARAYDPQRFHLDEAAGAESLFGGLAASGWHLNALWCQHMVTGVRRAASMLAPPQQGAALARFGPSPGFEDLQWKRPGLAGDRLRFFSTPTKITEHEHRPDWAVLWSDNGAVNQNGALVFRFTGRVMIRQ